MSIMATIRWCPVFPSHGTFTNPCHKHFFSPRRHCSLTQHWHVHSSLTLSSASLATFSVTLTARRWQTNLHELLLVLHPLHPQTTQPTRHRKLLAGSRQALLTLRRQTMGGGVFWNELGQRQRQGGTGTAEDDQQRKVMKVMSCDSKKVRHARRGHLVNMETPRNTNGGVMRPPQDLANFWEHDWDVDLSENRAYPQNPEDYSHSSSFFQYYESIWQLLFRQTHLSVGSAVQHISPGWTDRSGLVSPDPFPPYSSPAKFAALRRAGTHWCSPTPGAPYPQSERRLEGTASAAQSTRTTVRSHWSSGGIGIIFF